MLPIRILALTIILNLLQQSSLFCEAFFTNPFTAVTKTATAASRVCRARDLIQTLVEEEQCFTTEAGAKAFGNSCASDIIYEDCYEPQPIVGKTV